MYKTQDEARGEQSFSPDGSASDFTNDIEYQALYGGDVEKECGVAWDECTKYPGHEGFIPLPDFSLQHLPERFQREDILEHIKAHADLTVRLRVKTSPERPQTDQFAKSGGFTGTAFVSRVEPLDKGCFCKECKTYDHKDRKWWRIALNSATHCIYDEYEAGNVRVDFFYDSKEAQGAGKVKTLRGVRMMVAVRNMDICLMECATHDENLGTYLDERTMKTMELQCPLGTESGNIPLASSEKKVMVCVSHPHGRPKQVTVGELVDQYNAEFGKPVAAARLTGVKIGNQFVDYTTRTCHGSSGANVVCLDFLVSENVLDRLSFEFTHQKGDRQKGLNTGCGEKQSTESECKSVEEWRDILFKEDGTLNDEDLRNQLDDEELLRLATENHEGPLAWADG